MCQQSSKNIYKGEETQEAPSWTASSSAQEAGCLWDYAEARKETAWAGVFVQNPLARTCAAPDLGKRATQPYRPVQHKQLGDLSLLSILGVCRRNFGISFLRPSFPLQGMPRPVRCLVVQCLSRQCLRPASHCHTVWLFCSIRQEGLRPQDTWEARRWRYCTGPPSRQWACTYCE